MSTLLCCAFFAVLHKAEEAPWSRRHVVKERIASVVVEILRKHFAVYVSGEAARRARSSQVEIPAKIFAKGFPGG